MDDQTTPTDATEPVGFGVRIRQAREAQGISLGDMAMRSRLSIAQLRAIESEDIDALPDAVYVRAFLRGIAQVLELDAQALVNDYVTRFCGGVAPVASATPAHGTCNECVINDDKPHRGLKRLIALLLLIVMGAGGWYVYNDFFTNRTTTVPPVTLEEKVDVKTETPAVSLPETPEVAPTETPAVEAPQSEAPASTVEPKEEASDVKVEPAPVETAPARPSHIVALGFEAKADCWVQVKNPAGQVLFTGIVKAGSPMTLDAPKGSSVVIGNATSMHFMQNGERVPLTGLTKGVAHLTL